MAAPADPALTFEALVPKTKEALSGALQHSGVPFPQASPASAMPTIFPDHLPQAGSESVQERVGSLSSHRLQVQVVDTVKAPRNQKNAPVLQALLLVREHAPQQVRYS